MSTIDIIDESFDKNITTSYFLSIRVSPDGLSFTVLDPVRNIYILFRHYDFEKDDANYVKTQELLITDPVLNYDYKRVYVLFTTRNATLVPGSLYNYDKTKEVLLFTSRIKEEEFRIITHKIKLANVWNVFAVPEFLYHLVKNQYKEVVFFQQYTPMVEANLMSDIVKSEPVMYVNVHKKTFDIVILKEYAILFCNSYRYTNGSEFAYFLLNNVKQLNLDQNNLKVFISGVLAKGDDTILLLTKYLKKVDLIYSTKHFDFSNNLRTVKVGEYYNLFSLPLCV